MSGFEQRFGGTRRLYGNQQTDWLREAHFCVVGIGGVGSWVAEAFARTAVGNLTLIDLDDICTTNTNRQIHAMLPTVGNSKVEVMAERIRLINPDCLVHCIEDFVTPDNCAEYLQKFDYVIDATDSVKAKAAIIAHCKRRKIPVLTVGGAGGQTDPTQVSVADLAKTTQDPLAAKVRAQLRRQYGFTSNPQRRFAVDCVFSTEQLKYPQADGTVCETKSLGEGSVRLDCRSGFGAAVAVTGTFGFVAAARTVDKYLQKRQRQESGQTD
ncbi:tRNA cyclic N6-threonylcarbamoyladenosine(37) synthase TcdA [Bowmanella dokdonensis]|uniref:tRNA threonylcarbamoyladenosine dehydratase n=1 Tax=Bowmanella dokdonensis TaxID=751969 RepID=A0A939IR15_9ALTE|nr:tRNA cyclic N6-threonylcarbamoyladenosine(37) synthase TcdA [Bowmanella dokdonensis]MBN7825167.1 tRNA cyclic N6-threonylcarbamoyladenosine(37) synthase TcdA [Bowmanella dokdonensis]